MSETVTIFVSIERCQKNADVLEIRPGEIKGGHLGSRLDRLWIGDPARQVSRVVWQGAGGNRAPAHQMGQVGGHSATGFGAADRVASAAMKDKEALAAGDLRQGWGWSWLQLPV